MGSPGGFMVHPGLFRVPDLKTEEQFVDYMREVYGVKVTFAYLDANGNELSKEETGVAVSPARALGQSFNISPLAQQDGRMADNREHVDVENVRSLVTGKDPVLEAYNNRSLPAAYNTNPIGSNPAEDDDRAPSHVVDKQDNVSQEEAEDSAVVPDKDDDPDKGSSLAADPNRDDSEYEENEPPAFSTTFEDTDEFEDEDENDDESEDEDEAVFDYSTWRKPELEQECRERGLPVSGTVSELAQRLRDDDEAKKTN